jgi:mono/diheme cytochrome c family protein
MEWRRSLRRTVLIALVLLAAEAAAALALRASGWLDVSAIPPPSRFEEWFLGGVADRSIEARARPITGLDRDDPKLLAVGLAHYNDMCITCHGAPGVPPSEIARGLNPPAPRLWSDDSQSVTDGELYWTVENGIRMTGMPAFGPTHGDAELRAIAAFVRRLPKLRDGEYAALVRASGLTLPGERTSEETKGPPSER